MLLFGFGRCCSSVLSSFFLREVTGLGVPATAYFEKAQLERFGPLIFAEIDQFNFEDV
jgi:hypothetical protein